MTCPDCKEHIDALSGLLRSAVVEKDSLVDAVEPLLAAIGVLDTPAGRANFVMCGAQSMEHIVQLYRELPEELRGGK